MAKTIKVKSTAGNKSTPKTSKTGTKASPSKKDGGSLVLYKALKKNKSTFIQVTVPHNVGTTKEAREDLLEKVVAAIDNGGVIVTDDFVGITIFKA